MKVLGVFVFFGCCFTTLAAFEQTPKAIEADLLKSFKKIDYWDDQVRSDTSGNVSFNDSLEKANDIFAEKLKNYTIKYPLTIHQEFVALKKARLDIFSSSDGLFRIYSWETWLGGTMRDFANVFQYKIGSKTLSVYVHDTNTNDQQKYVPFYSNLYTFKVNEKTYYLGVYGCIYSTKDAGGGIQIFDIENGELNQAVKLIKTASGLHSQIEYNFNFFSEVDWKVRPTPYFDPASQTIKIPIVNGSGNMTHNYIIYKFTGQYFEKIKS